MLRRVCKQVAVLLRSGVGGFGWDLAAGCMEGASGRRPSATGLGGDPLPPTRTKQEDQEDSQANADSGG